MRYFQYYTSLADFPDPLLEQHETFLFDCDGLILDTEPLYTAAACQLIAELGEGLQLSSLPCSLKLSIMGRTRLAVAQRLTDWLQAAHGIHCPASEWSTRVLPLEEALFARGCPLLPGAAELILILSLSQEKRLALATSSHRHSFLIKSQPHSATVFSHFHSIVCGDELGTHPAPSKPHPRIFQLAHLAVDSGLAAYRSPLRIPRMVSLRRCEPVVMSFGCRVRKSGRRRSWRTWSKSFTRRAVLGKLILFALSCA